jgi:MFS transporter, PAT family, beta-lactamase induction signal transducer AmpG
MDPRVLAIGCIAYANGLPLLLTSKTLAVWLQSYGLSYTSIGLFGLLHLPYTVKFLWAPILDHVPLPFLKKLLGQRRSWLCLVQITGIGGLLAMISLDPILNLKAFVACGFLVTISAASQHILLLAYQMETLDSRDWGIGEGMGVFGFRMAILTGGAGALYLATFLSWKEVYLLISLLMSIGLIAVLIMQEPNRFAQQHTHSFTKRWEWMRYALIGPFKDFMLQKGWQAILVFMLIYRLPDNLLAMMQTLFYVDLGFSFIEIGSVEKVFGLGAMILGGFIGGYCIRIYGFKKTLFWGGLIHGLSCLLFLMQAQLGPNLSFLYLTIGVEHFFSGVALTAFFSYQLTCCSLRFAATQLALLTSFAELGRVFANPLAGLIIDFSGWTPWLIVIILSSIPAAWWISRIPFSRP